MLFPHGRILYIRAAMLVKKEEARVINEMTQNDDVGRNEKK